MNLSRREISTLVRLLGLLQTHLESAIESHTLEDGSIQPGDPVAACNVPKDRRDWNTAEELVKKLDDSRRRMFPRMRAGGLRPRKARRK